MRCPKPSSRRNQARAKRLKSEGRSRSPSLHAGITYPALYLPEALWLMLVDLPLTGRSSVGTAGCPRGRGWREESGRPDTDPVDLLSRTDGIAKAWVWAAKGGHCQADLRRAQRGEGGPEDLHSRVYFQAHFHHLSGARSGRISRKDGSHAEVYTGSHTTVAAVGGYGVRKARVTQGQRGSAYANKPAPQKQWPHPHDHSRATERATGSHAPPSEDCVPRCACRRARSDGRWPSTGARADKPATCYMGPRSPSPLDAQPRRSYAFRGLCRSHHT
eukprot:scaffold2910_cov390-Prasinococcus_capsulatus_cf.AAC.36